MQPIMPVIRPHFHCICQKRCRAEHDELDAQHLQDVHQQLGGDGCASSSIMVRTRVR